MSRRKPAGSTRRNRRPRPLEETSMALRLPGSAPGASNGDSLVSVQNLVKHFPVRGGVFFREIGQVHAVDDISLEIKQGETLGLVGDSGCGKTTAGRVILRLTEATSGKVMFEGKNIFKLGSGDLKQLRRDMQVIFQDPRSEEHTSELQSRQYLVCR